jgi:ribose transport system substrate-binding protein
MDFFEKPAIVPTSSGRTTEESMSSVESSANGSKRPMRWILRIGVLAVIGIVSYIAWPKSTVPARQKIAVLTWNQDPFWELVQTGANDAAKELNVDLTFIESTPGEAAQNQHVQQLLASGIQALAISPNNPQTQKSVIDDAASNAVVITFDSDAPDTKRRGFVGTNNYAAGQVAAEEVRSAIPDGGKVIISVGSVDMSNGRDRRQGLIDDLMDRPFKSEHAYDAIDATLNGAKYEVVSTVTDGGDAGKASQGVTDAIKANPDVKCIVGLFSYSGPAIVKAVGESGKKGQIKVIGFDESPEEQADVVSGDIYSSVLQDQYRCGYEAVRVLADLLRGIQVKGPSGPMLTELPVLVMRPDNIQALRNKQWIRTPGK